MIFNPLYLKDAYLINTEKKIDNRGYFSRFFCKSNFGEMGLETHWRQMNTSFNNYKGTVRGLHFRSYQLDESKLVRCVRGAIWDVIVDLRKDSSTFGKWYGTQLNDKNLSMIYVPKGFAHGFQTLMDNVEVFYLNSELYNPEFEMGLTATDSYVNINWPQSITVQSERDLNLPSFKELF